MNNKQTSISHRYKLLNPCRNQIEMQLKCLDDLLPPEHKARAVWEFVDKMDLTSCYGEILSYKNEAGRSTTSPKVLLCLWIYSILDGNISARKIEELCCYHDVYKWIAGGTPVNRTMISEFRSENPEKFEDLLTSCLAVMVQGNVISDQDFAQDGTRVKASAGFNSFHRDETSAYSAKADIEAAAMLFPNCRYFSPAKLKKDIDPKKVQKSDSEAVIKWRETLETDEMKESYSQRCSTAEFSNAQTKNQGMGEFLVRGFRKVRGMVNLHAISHNITRYWDLSRKMSPQAL